MLCLLVLGLASVAVLCVQISRQSNMYDANCRRPRLFLRVFAFLLVGELLMGVAVLPCMVFLIPKIDSLAAQKSDSRTI